MTQLEPIFVLNHAIRNFLVKSIIALNSAIQDNVSLVQYILIKC